MIRYYFSPLGCLLWVSFVFYCLAPAETGAQVDLRITPQEKDYTIAVPPLCTTGRADDPAAKVTAVIAGDLKIAGIARVLAPDEFSSPTGQCANNDGGPFEAQEARGHSTVAGTAKFAGEGEQLLVFNLYLIESKTGRPMLGKRYQANSGEEEQVAHAFANEIVSGLTGKAGIFGRQMLFVSDVDGHRELFTLALGSSQRRQLTEDRALAADPSWSPAGDRIVYSSTRKDGVDLYLVPSDGGPSRRLTFLPGKEESPQFFPDGKSLLASAEVSGRRALVIFNLQGRLLEKLTDSSADCIDPALSPDGELIAFSTNAGGTYKIALMRRAGGPAKPLALPGLQDCFTPAWAPDGQRLAFACRKGGVQEIFLSNLSGDDAAQVTFGGASATPRWSPDGRYLVFTSQSNDKRRLAVLAVQELRAMAVASGSGEDSDPVWFPR